MDEEEASRPFACHLLLLSATIWFIGLLANPIQLHGRVSGRWEDVNERDECFVCFLAVLSFFKFKTHMRDETNP